MDQDGRRYLRKAARTRDESYQARKFRKTLAQADADKVEANRKADRVKAEKAAKKRGVLEAFQPILSLAELKKMTIANDRLTRIRQQLVWHRDIGKDANLKGIHKMKKEVAWDNMVRAVQRHCEGTSSAQGMSPRPIYSFVTDRYSHPHKNYVGEARVFLMVVTTTTTTGRRYLTPRHTLRMRTTPSELLLTLTASLMTQSPSMPTTFYWT